MLTWLRQSTLQQSVFPPRALPTEPVHRAQEADRLLRVYDVQREQFQKAYKL